MVGGYYTTFDYRESQVERRQHRAMALMEVSCKLSVIPNNSFVDGRRLYDFQQLPITHLKLLPNLGVRRIFGNAV